MTKNELAKALADKIGITHQHAVQAVEGIMEVMKESFLHHEDIYLRGFGNFKIIERKGKTARDITRGSIIIVPRHHIVKFIPSKELKAKI